MSVPIAASGPVEAASVDARYPPIAAHGIIGDLHTVALVCTDGTICWFCPQRFDSPTVFASLLDADRGGSFTVRPAVRGMTTKQIYLPDTPILITRFLTPDGVGEVTDFMPIRAPGECALIRRVEVVRGQMGFEMHCRPAFDYGRQDHRVRIEGSRAFFDRGD